MSDERTALIERLRDDVDRLRNLARLESPFFRWTGEMPNGYRMKTDVASDIEALLNALTGDDT